MGRSAQSDGAGGGAKGAARSAGAHSGAAATVDSGVGEDEGDEERSFRVKLYEMHPTDGRWEDLGVGRVFVEDKVCGCAGTPGACADSFVGAQAVAVEMCSVLRTRLSSRDVVSCLPISLVLQLDGPPHLVVESEANPGTLLVHVPLDSETSFRRVRSGIVSWVNENTKVERALSFEVPALCQILFVRICQAQGLSVESKFERACS